jgi:hypothetical protein
MTRRLAAVALVAAALGAAAPAAHAANCGPVLDAVARALPEPVRQVYLEVCGV